MRQIQLTKLSGGNWLLVELDNPKKPINLKKVVELNEGEVHILSHVPVYEKKLFRYAGKYFLFDRVIVKKNQLIIKLRGKTRKEKIEQGQTMLIAFKGRSKK